MQVLNLSTDTFDQVNTFGIVLAGRRGDVTIKASLHKGYQKEGDGILWALKNSACLKAQYTEADDAERARLSASTPLRHGDTVEIEGKQYKVRVLGNFSDCAIFDAI